MSSPAEASHSPAPIPEVSVATSRQFADTILAAARPVVFRGLVRDWPLTKAGLASPTALAAYLKQMDAGAPVSAMTGPANIGGAFAYNGDLSGFNFRRVSLRLSDALDLLLDYASREQAPSLAVQSVPVRAHLPGFERENRMPLLDNAVEPRVWVGNAAVTLAHHDPSENIACCVAGRRRFTLFPPEQLPNLYMGPLESTPAGPAISMVDVDAPDLARFPRFAEAMKAALCAELEPGDALYIPYLWWHHVRAMDPVSMLVNYWWTPPDEGRGRPIDALMHAMVAVRDLPPAHRAAWRVMFDHYVFENDGPVAEHLPPERRGVAGRLDARIIRAIRSALSRSLSRP